MRVLGLDFGSVRIGLALSDPLGLTAQPHAVLARKEDVLGQLRTLIAEYEVGKAVVGYPRTLRGDQGLATEAVDKFVAELKAGLSIPVEVWDERLTTAQADRILLEGNVRRAKRKNVIDKVAAAVMLQSYLDAGNS